MPEPELMPEPVLMPEPELEPEPEIEAEPKPAAAPLGSAPIPSVKPPVDIEITGETEVIQEPPAEPDFEATMVIAPDASVMSKKQPQNSTEAFISRVKEQLSSPENLPETGEDAFSSTVPQ